MSMDLFGRQTIHQASAVPFRCSESSLEICLVTSSSSRQWVFPKGLIDPGETAEQTALKESWEEAGLRGRVVGEPLGVYQYRKWNRDLNVLVMLLDVATTAEQWQEQDFRERCWVGPDQAENLLQREYLLGMLRVALERLTKGEMR
ncbi:MAG: NUDIX hydrolase [Planctomycetales bacterium]|nr:NUDIX hydrolase [Planctomycetales bacterium]